jgi:hypothetical protein
MEHEKIKGAWLKKGNEKECFEGGGKRKEGMHFFFLFKTLPLALLLPTILSKSLL